MGALRRAFGGAIIAVLWLAAAASADAQEQAGSQGRRVALVIGNSAYQTVGVLPNPANDADAVAESLGRLGFDVTKVDNATIGEMRAALQSYENKVAGSEIAVVYYAGHGMEMNGENYLIPIDAKLSRDTHVQDEALPLSRVLAAVEGASKLRLIMLDACRNNPFAAQMVRSDPRRAVTRGLALVEPTGSTLVSYAAKGGTTADDGSGEHSPYTTALLANLETPGLEISFLFRKVRAEVMRETSGNQEPFTYGSLGEQLIYFREEQAPPAANNQQASPAVVDPDANVASAYQAATAINTIEAWDAFLKYHDSGYYADLARAARNKLDPPVFVANVPAQPEVTQQATTDDAAQQCDRLTAYEYDPQRPSTVPGVSVQGVRDNIDAARTACTTAVQDHPTVGRYLYQLGRIENIAGNYSEAARLYEQAGGLGSGAAMNDLGVLYQLGTGVTQSFETARQWYEKAAAVGATDAMANLGNLYDQGQGIPQDLAESGRWYEKGAAMGNADAIAAIGYRFDEGRGVTQDWTEARKWYEKAALKGSAYAMNNLGFLFDWGRGGAEDFALARYWYEKASALGNAWAMNNLGFLYENGRGVSVDYGEARKWYEQAASAGNAVAMNNLGNIYSNGRGVTVDYSQAFTWYTQAANAGNLDAMTNLGNLYDNGQGTTQDFAQAKFWYEKAAAAGNGNAIHNMGYLYEVGHGVPQDNGMAAAYYVQALQQRNAATITEFRDNSTSYSVEVRRAVQQFLIDQGYLSGPADGVIGLQSQEALTAWQNGGR
jgi:TPR repeat protein